jgi:RNA ligase (TIGR02306 family)
MENVNSVAFISKINNILPILGADKIQLAKCENWTSIVQRDIHKEGDLVLCITTDAVIPEEPAKVWGVINYLRKGNRVRTIKLKGVYSECILIPLKDVPQGLISFGNVSEGKDMMERLGIFKYEPPEIQIQDSKGRKHKYHQNPNFHIYYKFPNQKNTPNMFNEEDDVVITRKIHGSNFRAGIVQKKSLSLRDKILYFFTKNELVKYQFVVGSHNVEKYQEDLV